MKTKAGMNRRRLITVKCNECGERIGSAILEFNDGKADLENTWLVKSIENTGSFRLSFICNECALRKLRSGGSDKQ